MAIRLRDLGAQIRTSGDAVTVTRPRPETRGAGTAILALHALSATIVGHFRIGHIGYVDVVDITTVLGAIELVEMGDAPARGAAGAAALTAYETAR